MDKKIYILDSTLRDGMQSEGISFSVDDKLKIARALDNFGIDYIEAGNPVSNPKDVEFFERVKNEQFLHSKLVAFGSTLRHGKKPEEDENIRALIKADTPVVCVFGKTWKLHVKDILKISYEENLKIIKDTVSYLKKAGKEVIFDAEHFFDGFKDDCEYAISAIKAADDAGADFITLCDTNGAAFPYEIEQITQTAQKAVRAKLGIHCHNDTGMAVANSIYAVKSGAVHVQGTINGIGERCGNANLCTIIPNLQLKLDYKCVDDGKTEDLTSLSGYVSEILNLANDKSQPYVGASAFSHKAGMHVDGVLKNPKTFEHIKPESVGNSRHILVSEMSGKANVYKFIKQVDPYAEKDGEAAKKVVKKLKELEYGGYQFEGAESSMELLVRRILGKYRPFFKLDQFKVIISEPPGQEKSASALIKIHVGDSEEITAAEGEGPVDALDKALRKALERFYPRIADVRLTDYKVRVLEGDRAVESLVRVLVESSDGVNKWSTVGVSRDIIEASWVALVDSVEYKLLTDAKKMLF